MKLTLKAQAGIQILSSTGDINSRDIQVLRAGITQLMKSGKNKIVFEIPDADKLPAEILRELSMLDLLARELSGRVALAGTSPLLRQQIQRFAQPPVIQCFDSAAAAIKHFADAAAAAKQAAPPAPAPASTAAPTPAAKPQAAAPEAPKPAPADVAVARAEVRQKELSELTDFRKRIAQLENENQLLRDKLISALEHRRAAVPPAAAQKKIEDLEQKIEELLTQAAQPKK